ncbi:hypothetical protein TYRP_003839 [Tyrophagus putrescentiae]|nr:hypothetical protein TYRP_003839 [Tyrophagus putrescentiae]
MAPEEGPLQVDIAHRGEVQRAETSIPQGVPLQVAANLRRVVGKVKVQLFEGGKDRVTSWLERALMRVTTGSRAKEFWRQDFSPLVKKLRHSAEGHLEPP